MKTRRHIGLRLLVAVGTLAILAWRLDVADVWRSVSGFPAEWFCVLALLLGAGLVLNSWKWKTVLDGLGRPMPLTELIRLSWIAQFFGTFLPGRTGGDVVRAYALSREDGAARSVVSVVIDRGLNLVALVAIAGVAACLDGPLPADTSAALRVIALLCVAAGAIAFVFRRRLINACPRFIREPLSGLSMVAWRPSGIALAAGLAVAYQLVMVVMNVAGARALDLPVATGALFIAVPVTALITALPISISGLGVREAAYASTLALFGLPAESGVALSLVLTAAIVGWNLIGGVLYLFGSLGAQTAWGTPENPVASGGA